MTRRAGDERGLSLVLMALLMTTLLGIAALVVDLGSWQVEASNVQQAADAAALAGVVRLPDGDNAAITRAREVAADNGYAHDPAGTGVTVEVTPRVNETLEVTVTQPDVRQFFSQVVRGSTTITRSGTAQYVQPVPLGSARNYLGTGALYAGFEAENFFLAVSNQCTRREYGDRIFAQFDAWADGGDTCTAPDRVDNLEFTENGYLFGVEVPAAMDGTPVDIDMFDAPTCIGSVAGEENHAPFDTRVVVRRADDLDPFAGTVVPSPHGGDADYTVEGGNGASGNCGGGDTVRNCTGEDIHDGGADLRGCWARLATVDAAGTYYVQVQPQFVDADTRHNHFSFRAGTGAGFTPCTSDPVATGYIDGAPCPNVFGVQHLPVLAQVVGTAADFYLADVDARHNNKTMQVTLYDPAEGAESIEILDPQGNPQSFDWEVLCADGDRNDGGGCSQGDAAPDGGWESTASTTPLDVSGTGTPPFSGSAQSGKYSGRVVRLTFKLPSDIASEYDGATWWRIRYRRSADTDPGGTDRTTWSVQLLGNPVRLVPNQPPPSVP